MFFYEDFLENMTDNSGWRSIRSGNKWGNPEIALKSIEENAG